MPIDESIDGRTQVGLGQVGLHLDPESGLAQRLCHCLYIVRHTGQRPIARGAIGAVTNHQGPAFREPGHLTAGGGLDHRQRYVAAFRRRNGDQTDGAEAEDGGEQAHVGRAAGHGRLRRRCRSLSDQGTRTSLARPGRRAKFATSG